MCDAEVHGFQACVNRKERLVGSIPEIVMGRPIGRVFFLLCLCAGGADHEKRGQKPASPVMSHEDRLCGMKSPSEITQVCSGAFAARSGKSTNWGLFSDIPASCISAEEAIRLPLRTRVSVGH